MNKNNDEDQVTSDDQELANVLAEVTGANGVQPSVNEPAFIEPPVPAGDPAAEATQNPVLDDSPMAAPATDQPLVPTPPTPMPTSEPMMTTSMPTPDAPNGDLEVIKQQAIGELRPLVDKLNVAPEEKFDTLLLLIRSTDDQSLIAPAHQAAREIMDESRKAKALLDIIKEVDYLSNKQ